MLNQNGVGDKTHLAQNPGSEPQCLHTPGVIVPISYLTQKETAMNSRSVWDTQYITGQFALQCETVSK